MLKTSDTPLVEVVQVGAPSLPIKNILPFISMVAVTNTALINMLMASRLIYGMARQRVLPPMLGAVSPRSRSPWVAIVFTTAVAFGVISYVTVFASDDAIAMLGGTTSLLLLAVFAMVNIAVVVLRRDASRVAAALPDPDAAAVRRLRGVAVSGDAAVRPAAAAVRVGGDPDRQRGDRCRRPPRCCASPLAVELPADLGQPPLRLVEKRGDLRDAFT